MRENYLDEQRLLLTEQTSDINKAMALLEVTEGAEGFYDLFPANLKGAGLTDYFASSPEMLKLYMAAHFSDKLKYLVKTGLPSATASSLKKKYYEKLTTAKTVKDIESITTELSEETTAMMSRFDTTGYSQVIKLAIQYVHLRRYQPLSVNDVADHLKVNRSHLSHQFKKEVGVSLIAYIHGVKLSMADQLIQSREYRLSEISDLLGYSSYGYFCKVYKRYRGVLPRTM